MRPAPAFRRPGYPLTAPGARLAALLALLTALATTFGQSAPPPADEPRIQLTVEERAYLRRLGPIKICPDPDWAPFQVRDEEGRFHGIAIDLLELIARRLQLDFTYVTVRDWDEALALARAGRVQVLHFLNQSPQRDTWLNFTAPLLVDPNVFITRAEHAFITDATQLSDEVIALPVGTSVEERVRRDFPNLKVLAVQSEADAFDAVSYRAADLTLRSLTVAAYTIRKEGLFNLEIAGQAPDAYVNRLRMGVIKTEPMLRDILDQGIATITAREREAIVNRHVNITVVEPLDYGFILRLAGGLAVLIGVSFYWNLRLKRINAALRESERSKAVLIANLPGVAYRCRYDRDWTMEFISAGCLELTGYLGEDLLHNRRLSFNDLIVPEDRERVWQIWEEARHGSRSAKLEYRIQTADQRVKWVFEQGVFVAADAGGEPGMMEGLIIDITAQKRVEAELYRVSIHDELTGLHNRRYLLERLGALNAESARTGRTFAVSLIDLDFFKRINDVHGHAGGDFVLREFADLLRAHVRPYDLAGRYGGEEFILVTLDSDIALAAVLLDRLRTRLRERVFRFEGRDLRVTFSAGVASRSARDGDVSVESLIAEADGRLYQAKAAGRDRVVPGPAAGQGEDPTLASDQQPAAPGPLAGPGAE